MGVLALTVNEVCLSGIDAIALADRLITVGEFAPKDKCSGCLTGLAARKILNARPHSCTPRPRHGTIVNPRGWPIFHAALSLLPSAALPAHQLTKITSCEPCRHTFAGKGSRRGA